MGDIYPSVSFLKKSVCQFIAIDCATMYCVVYLMSVAKRRLPLKVPVLFCVTYMQGQVKLDHFKHSRALATATSERLYNLGVNDLYFMC